MGQLLMKWNNGTVPEFDLPKGYELIQYRRGGTDDMTEEEFKKAWIETRLSAGEPEKAEAWFYNVHNDPTVPDDGFFAIFSGDKMASSAHIQLENHEVGTATLHEVWTDAAHRGKGLGKIITGAVMKNAQSRGIDTVYLTTDDFRIPAIRAYLKMGFFPVLYEDGQRERWEKIFAGFKLKECPVEDEKEEMAVLSVSQD